MNVLQVTTSNSVYPPTTGGYHRIHGLVSELPSMDDSVFRFCQTGPLASRFGPYPNALEEGETARIDDGYVEHRHVRYRYDVLKAVNIFVYPVGWNAILRHRPPRKLTKLLSWADIVLNEGPYQVPALTEQADSTPVIYSSHNVEAESAEARAGNPFGDWVYRKVAEIEERALECAAAVVCTSERDEREFEYRYGGSSGPTIVIPNGVSSGLLRDSFTPTARGSALKERHGIDDSDPIGLFIGSKYGPNVTAANEVFGLANRLQEQDVSAHFFVVGSVGQALSDGPSSVTVTGFVDDIEPYFDAATFAVNPVRTGSGTNIKLLDYFARSLPVITTEFGARGFDLEHEREVLIADGLDEFVEYVLELSDSEDAAARIGERGRRFVEERYTWQALSRELRTELVQLCCESRPSLGQRD